MNEKKDFYPAGDHFYKVVALHDHPELEWTQLQQEAPLLPRGWYELSRLQREDRIEFTRDFWLSKLPIISSSFERRLEDFFVGLEDLGIFLTQVKKEAPFEVHMVYSLKDAVGFFQGGPPATDEMLINLEKQFGHVTLPRDYLDFLKVHDGFSKYMDTGLIKVKDMARTYQKFQELFDKELPTRTDHEVVNPTHLIPFYESYGLHCYQCFYADWYPEEEMGNVYFSYGENSISNFLRHDQLEENLAFPNYVAWLIFYLEDLFHL